MVCKHESGSKPMLTNDMTPNSGHTSDRLNEGERFYNLSDKTPEEAETIWQALSDFITYPFLMPDGTIRRPPGQTSDRLHDPAFPLADHGEFLATGLTKREWFAAMALQGILANVSDGEYDEPYDAREVCRAAVGHADLLIAALNPAPEPTIENIPWGAESGPEAAISGQ